MENSIIGGVLLYITGMIHGKSTDTMKARIRLLAGSFMCGAFSLIIILGVKELHLILMEMVFAAAVCMVTFGKVWRYALTFILVTYFMGGITMGMLLVTDNTGIYTAVGIYTGDMKAGLLALFVVVTLITAKQVIDTVKKRKFYCEHIFDVKIAVEGKIVETRGFLDTGNGLIEPVSGKPAAVADEKLWEKLENADMIVQNRFCAIPCETINGKSLLIAIRTDFIELNGEQIKGAVLAKGGELFFAEDTNHADCCLLLSRDMIKGGI